jgi:adenylyl-sulfate kinase
LISKEIHPHQHTVTLQARSLVKGHQPLVIWMTGLSGSGKSTIANALEHKLVLTFQAHTCLLDGDNIRTGLNADLGFSEEDRRENIRRIGEVAKLMYNAGLIVITAFISPFRTDRDRVRALLPEGGFWEIFVSCPLEICQQRDPKGLYQKAINGELSEFTGVTSPYEPPDAPELEVQSDKYSVDECVEMIIARMIENKVITKSN